MFEERKYSGKEKMGTGHLPHRPKEPGSPGVKDLSSIHLGPFGDRAKEHECTCRPYGNLWEDPPFGNDQEAQVIILMWHLSECGTPPWDDFLGWHVRAV